MVRVRIAPSPTGPFHIGTARTALFNWLYARKHQGAFVLRVEDTDRERSQKVFEEDIIAQLRWLGLDWDEGPYRQSERLPLYTKALEELLEKGFAYYCGCSSDLLQSQRDAAAVQHLPYRYPGTCRAGERRQGVIRLNTQKLAGETFVWEDLVHGTIAVRRDELDDFIIAKSFEEPLYNFAVVVDDVLMEISHVIRGEDHISNTPKQMVIVRALGAPSPKYGHIPLILNSDRSKISKRLGQVSVASYRQRGYLPKALVNFFALLGWNPGTDQELFTLEELSSAFDLSRVQKSGAAFNEEKLRWFNHAYLDRLSQSEWEEQASNHLPPLDRRVNVAAALKIVRPRVHVFEELPSLLEFLQEARVLYEPIVLLWPKALKTQSAAVMAEAARKRLLEVSGLLQKQNNWSVEALEASIKNQIQENQWGVGDTLWPLRVALSGAKESPTPFELLAMCGREVSQERLHYAIGLLSTITVS